MGGVGASSGAGAGVSGGPCSGGGGAGAGGRARRWSRGARGLCAGARVVRGPDWKWRDQDGPHPALGTLTSDLHNGWVDVKLVSDCYITRSDYWLTLFLFGWTFLSNVPGPVTRRVHKTQLLKINNNQTIIVGSSFTPYLLQ